MNADMKKRILLMVAGMNILAIGIILNTKSTLGVGAINTVPYTAAEIAGVSLGTTTVILYFLFIGAQCILTRKADITAFLQLPFSFLFGAVINLYDAVIRITPVSITGKLLILAAAILLTALGTYLMTMGNLILNPPDGMVRTLSEFTGKPLGLTRNIFDISMVVLSAAAGLILRGWTVGIGIGTLLSALLIGRFISVFQRVFTSGQHTEIDG